MTCDVKGGGPARYEIWLNRKEKGFEYGQAIEGYYRSGAVSFQDMDSDGTIDLVIPACPEKTDPCNVYIIYNKQMGLCDGKNKLCREKTNLCVADPNFKLDFKSSSVIDDV